MSKSVLPHISKLRYTRRGIIFGAEFGTVVGDATYALRLAATDRAASLLFALGVEFRYVGPAENSGRAWYQFDRDAISVDLREIVDFIGDLYYGFPDENAVATITAPEMPKQRCGECGGMHARVRRRKHKGIVHLMCDGCLRKFERAIKGHRKNQELFNRKISPIVFQRDGYKCVCCGASSNLTVDHIVPVIKDGGNELSNLQTLCKRCNSKKGSK